MTSIRLLRDSDAPMGIALRVRDRVYLRKDEGGSYMNASGGLSNGLEGR
jgi:hypothetical protein